MNVLIDKKKVGYVKHVYNHGAGEYLEIKCKMMNYWYHLTLITLRKSILKKKSYI